MSILPRHAPDGTKCKSVACVQVQDVFPRVRCLAGVHAMFQVLFDEIMALRTRCGHVGRINRGTAVGGVSNVVGAMAIRTNRHDQQAGLAKSAPVNAI